MIKEYKNETDRHHKRKLTGILLFILPLTLKLVDLKYSGAIVSAVATFAAIQDGHLIRIGAGNAF